MTLWRLYVYDTLLERWAQDLEAMAAKLGELIQEEHPVVRQRHLTRPWELAPDCSTDHIASVWLTPSRSCWDSARCRSMNTQRLAILVMHWRAEPSMPRPPR
jgi:hypothetical protein